MKTKIIFLLKFIALLILYFIIMTIGGLLFPISAEIEPSPMASLVLLVQILVNSIAIVYLIKRLQLSGIKLIATTAIIVYGIQIFMTQIETWIFIDAFPMISKHVLFMIFTGSLFTTFLASIIAFWFWGQKKNETSLIDYKSITKGWRWKIPVLSVVYMILYFFFGTIIAWQSEELREFYAETVTNMNIILLRIIQVFRGFLWIVLLSPLILWLNAGRLEKITATTLVLAILPTILLLFPNPFMPAEIRITHFTEVFLSHIAFGIILSYTLTMKKI